MSYCQLYSLLELVRNENPNPNLQVQMRTSIRLQKIEFVMIGLADAIVVFQNFLISVHFS